MAIAIRDYTLQVCLMLLLFSKYTLSSQFSLLKCPIIHAQWEELMQSELSHLCRIREQFHLECIFEIIDFRFPRDVLRDMGRNSLITVYQILQLIFYFLSKDNPYDDWNSTCIEKLNNGLHQLITKVETCLGTTGMQREQMDFGKPSSYALTLEIKRYFQRLNNFLTNSEHRLCAWELIYNEIKQCLLFVTQLLKMLKK